MIQLITGPKDKDIITTDNPVTGQLNSAQFRNRILLAMLLLSALLKEFGIYAIRLHGKWLAPYINKSSRCVRREITKIHNKQNWFKRCGITLFDNAIGLGIAMLAARVVEDLVEVEQFSNLWGLLATRPVVSEGTYEVMSFTVEFVIALIVFTLTEHYLDEFRERRKRKQPEDHEIPEIEMTGN